MSDVTLLIAGVDRTYMMGAALKRSLQWGKNGSATVVLEYNPDTVPSVYKPNERDPVVIYLEGGTYLFFTGWINTWDEQYYEGGAPTGYQLTLNCVSYAARTGELYIPVDQDFLIADLNSFFIALQGFATTVGLTLVYSSTIGALPMDPTQTFNTPALSDILDQLSQLYGFVWCVDQSKNVQIFYPDLGYMAAPFTIADANGPLPGKDWQTMKISRGGQYRNIQLVATTQQLKNTGNNIDYVASATNVGEVATYGPVQAKTTISNVRSLSDLDAMAALILSQGVLHQVKVVLGLTRNRLEPGQLLSFHTSFPPLIDDFIIQQVDSEAQGETEDGQLFKHTVTCGNSMFRLGAGTAWAQGIVDRAATPPIDRISHVYVWLPATTIAGVTNPGLATGNQGPVLTVVADAIGVNLTILFPNGPPPTTDCIFDVLDGASSIFGTPKPVVKTSGGGSLDPGWSFASNPQNFKQGDQLTFTCLQADSAVTDVVVQLTLFG